MTLSKTGASGSTAFTSDIANLTYSQTFSGGVGLDSTGNVLDLSRAITLNNVGNTHTVSGAGVTISDSGTQTAGTLTWTGDTMRIAQNYTGANSSALNITTASTDAGTSNFALRVNDDGTFTDSTPFVVDESGNVGIGTTNPETKLQVDGNLYLNSGNTIWGRYQNSVSNYGTLTIRAGNVTSNKLTGIKIYGTDDTATVMDSILFKTFDLDRMIINSSGNVGIGTTTPDKLLSVWGGDGSIMDPTDLGTESLTNGALTAGTSWTATTDCALVTNAATCTFAAGTASTVQQASGTLAVAGVGSRWYKFVYTVSGLTGTPTANITTAFASATTALTLTAGTQTTYFKSATTPTDFVITTTLTAGQAFTLDTFSLKEVQGGDLALGESSPAEEQPD